MAQAKGNFTTQINRDKRPGDSKPVYTGRFTKPGTDDEYAFALFLGRSAEGGRYFSGNVSRQPVNGTLDSQLDALLDGKATEPKEGEVREFRIVLFDNKSTKPAKDGAGERPAMWGRVQLGRDEPEIHISAWERESRYQVNPHISKYLSGETQYPLQREAAPAKAEQGRGDDGR